MRGSGLGSGRVLAWPHLLLLTTCYLLPTTHYSPCGHGVAGVGPTYLPPATSYLLLTTYHLYYAPSCHGVAGVGVEDDHRVEVHARDEEGLG